ncbi:MAG TPA: hypothetical protein VGF39_17630 [Stellaceae bacterium]
MATDGGVFGMSDLPGGAVLINTVSGLFRFDPAAGRVVPVGGADTGSVSDMRALPGGAALINADNGLFRFDPADGRVVPAGEVAVGRVSDMHDLPGGVVLINAKNGLFRFDPAAGHVVPAAEAATDDIFDMRKLLGGAVLITARNGLFIAPAPALAEAEVTPATDFRRLTPSPNWQEVRVIFSHPCAPASGNLALALVPVFNGIERAGEPVRRVHTTLPSQNSTTLAASVMFDQPGNWSLQLRQGRTPAGHTMPFEVDPGFRTDGVVGA